MTGEIKTRRIVKIVALLYFFLNAILFLLREYDDGWWFADYQSYAGVSPDVHQKAFGFFVLYLLVFFVILIYCAKVDSKTPKYKIENTQGNYLKNRYLFAFCVVVILIIAQILLAIVDSVGIAGGVGNAPIYALPLLLISPDGVYFAYSLTEKNKKRLVVATVLFIVSNILRGWAGFIVPLAFIFYIRDDGFSRKKIFTLMLGFLLIVPILFIVRDYFRGGYSSYQLLIDSGFSGFSLLLEYSNVSMKLILSRFDLYSHYIGVLRHFGDGLPEYACNPIIENVFAKVILYPIGGFDCTPLGGLLPGEIYEFFRNKGTAYSVVGGFFALPFFDMLNFFSAYVFILLISSLFIFRKINKSNYSIFFVFLVMVFLFQGWMYQFTYNFLGFIFGIFLLKFVWKKNIYA